MKYGQELIQNYVEQIKTILGDYVKENQSKPESLHIEAQAELNSFKGWVKKYNGFGKSKEERPELTLEKLAAQTAVIPAKFYTKWGLHSDLSKDLASCVQQWVKFAHATEQLDKSREYLSSTIEKLQTELKEIRSTKLAKSSELNSAILKSPLFATEQAEREKKIQSVTTEDSAVSIAKLATTTAFAEKPDIPVEKYSAQIKKILSDYIEQRKEDPKSWHIQAQIQLNLFNDWSAGYEKGPSPTFKVLHQRVKAISQAFAPTYSFGFSMPGYGSRLKASLDSCLASWEQYSLAITALEAQHTELLGEETRLDTTLTDTQKALTAKEEELSSALKTPPLLQSQQSEIEKKTQAATSSETTTAPIAKTTVDPVAKITDGVESLSVSTDNEPTQAEAKVLAAASKKSQSSNQSGAQPMDVVDPRELHLPALSKNLERVVTLMKVDSPSGLTPDSIAPAPATNPNSIRNAVLASYPHLGALHRGEVAKIPGSRLHALPSAMSAPIQPRPELESPPARLNIEDQDDQISHSLELRPQTAKRRPK